MESLKAPLPERVDDLFVLQSLFQDVEAERYEANRRAARQCAQLADVLAFAREHPALYVNTDFDPRLAGGVPPLGGDAVLAERCAVREASSRLQLTEHEVRTQASLAAHARTSLPRLWDAAMEGLTTLGHVKAALDQVPAFTEHPDLVAGFDELMTDLAMSATVAGTRRQARVVADRLTSRTRTQRHADAFSRRTVYVEHVADGMSWISAMVSTERAHAIDRELSLTAKHMTVQERDGRTAGQIRADLFADLLTGGDVSSVKTKVLVTIPLDRLAPDAQASVRGGTASGSETTGDSAADRVAGGTGIAPVAGLDLNSDCLIPGLGPIDDATARQLLLDVGVFTRVITDPVTGVILDMDRRSRKATPAQRDWLTLRYGNCACDGCDRLAIDADIDHYCAYHGPHRGDTNITNLDPYCDPDHTLKDTTLLRHHRRDDGTIQIRFPTGHHTTNPFAGLHERVRAVLDNLPPTPETPPF